MGYHKLCKSTPSHFYTHMVFSIQPPLRINEWGRRLLEGGIFSGTCGICSYVRLFGVFLLCSNIITQEVLYLNIK